MECEKKMKVVVELDIDKLGYTLTNHDRACVGYTGASDARLECNGIQVEVHKAVKSVAGMGKMVYRSHQMLDRQMDQVTMAILQMIVWVYRLVVRMCLSPVVWLALSLWLYHLVYLCQ